ncbi:MAG: gamma-glutamyl hercynylcysteine S-oxide synthase [Solirubrobacteraceae bacterium]|nr:gamma-glutamyl hercynylcysteine S-oxide synthase [Solirubrobacteraceae bacterium]
MIPSQVKGYAEARMATVQAMTFADALHDVRGQTLALVAPFSHAELERVQHPLMSPLVWDLGHIAAYEDLWLVHRHGGEPLLRGDLAHLYDAFETPRATRGEIPFLRGDDVFAYIAAVRERTLEVLDRAGPGDGTLFEMVVRHEAQHNETMRQTLFLGGLPGGRPGPFQSESPRDDGWIDVPAGPFQLGAPAGGFAFDNERPRHVVELAAFGIARRPVTNATWMHFVEGGGYERREWWSDEGWSWKEEYDITHPEGWTADGPRDDDEPVLHVSWFEADALARSHGARLPTEAEWERAATWTRDPLQDVGHAWEWTGSHFDGYPGFVAHPYREYSEVFFGDRFRILRGASWATGDRLRCATFRNWDLPLRRQIFAGVRLAKDVT